MQRLPLLTAAFAATVFVAVPAFAQKATESHIVRDVSSIVGVTDVAERGEDVTGRLVNHSADTLKEVRVAVSHGFLWTNERNPGSDDPGWATIVTLTQPIPPHGTVPFTVATGAVPKRDDGRFTLEAKVVSFVAWGSGGAQSTVVQPGAPGL